MAEGISGVVKQFEATSRGNWKYAEALGLGLASVLSQNPPCRSRHMKSLVVTWENIPLEEMQMSLCGEAEHLCLAAQTVYIAGEDLYPKEGHRTRPQGPKESLTMA